MLVENRFREGVILCDPIQQLFKPMNFSLPIFLITYSCIVSYIIYIIPRPRDFYVTTRAFLVVFLLRYSFIYLVPLAPPKDMIALNDPVLDWIVGHNHEIFNDLFFSGHVADICIFFFCCRSVTLRAYYLGCIICVAVLLVWQHVHYTADVCGAPFFAFASYFVFARQRYKVPVNETVTASAVVQPVNEEVTVGK
jgi:hypothetical protein